MKVLVTMDLAGELVAEIGKVSAQVEVVQVASDEEALAVMRLRYTSPRLYQASP